MVERRPRMEGKVAIVTGAGSSGPGVGTGRAISTLFAREGASVLLADLEAARAEETLAGIEEEGGAASIIEVDVTDTGDCARMVREAVDRYGRLDVLVNNVGITLPGKVVDVAEEVWDRVLDVNLKSMMLTGKYAVPEMQRGGGGSIVNLSSVVAVRSGGGFDSVPYVVSKGGIVSLTISMASDYGPDNIRVNAILPGFIYTPMVAGGLTQEARELRRRTSPLGTEGTAWDVAYAALFLASDESRWVTGVALPVGRRRDGHHPSDHDRQPEAAMKRVLITGVSGLIGGLLARHLREIGGYEITALNRRPVEDFPCLQADIADLDAIRPAFDGIDTVVHMSAATGFADWEGNLSANIIGVRNVYEAARLAGVKRVVFGSSGAAIGGFSLIPPYDAIAEGRYEDVPDEWTRIRHDQIRPLGVYGAAKVFGEALGRHYSDAYGLSVLCVRIGSVKVVDAPDNPHRVSYYLSHRDLLRMLVQVHRGPRKPGVRHLHGSL